MQAVILAGGLATRMQPLTERTPKSLLPVAGRPFIAWQLEKLLSCGFSEIVVCVGYLGELIRDFVGDGSRFDLSVQYSEDGPKLLGTAGALRHALPLLASEFLVTYGDSYLPFDYTAPLADLRGHPEALGSMSVFLNQGRWDESNTEVEGDLVKRYVRGSRDPAVDHIDYGATALRRETIADVLPEVPTPLETVLTDLALSQKLRAFRVSERFYEIGSAAGLADLERMLASAEPGVKS
jgi:N-acetyl-alpha-D-muramate 1-phosphate uridylyltransferase